MSRLTPLLLFCLALTAGGCAVLGGAGSTADSGMGGVDKAFHDAYYDAQVAKLKGDRAGAKGLARLSRSRPCRSCGPL